MQDFMRARQERQKRLDKQWSAVTPAAWTAWGGLIGRDYKELYSDEREMLLDILDQDEDIMAVAGGKYRDRSGIAVATNKRVIFLSKGRVFDNSNVSNIPYRSITGVTHGIGMFSGEVQITGLETAVWHIEEVKPKETATLFANSVRALVDMAQLAVEAADPAPSAADELAKWAALLKDGILTQDEFDAQKKRLLGL